MVDFNTGTCCCFVHRDGASRIPVQMSAHAFEFAHVVVTTSDYGMEVIAELKSELNITPIFLADGVIDDENWIGIECDYTCQ